MISDQSAGILKDPAASGSTTSIRNFSCYLGQDVSFSTVYPSHRTGVLLPNADSQVGLRVSILKYWYRVLRTENKIRHPVIPFSVVDRPYGLGI